MVKMAVGNDNFLDLHAMLGCCSLQPTEFAARIDECALARGRAPQQCAVLLQWRYGDDSGFERRCGHERTNGEPGLPGTEIGHRFCTLPAHGQASWPASRLSAAARAASVMVEIGRAAVGERVGQYG